MAEPDQRPQPRRRERAQIVAALLLAGVVVWFALANSQRVSVDFLVTTTDARLIVVIAISLAAGVLLDRLALRRRRDD